MDQEGWKPKPEHQRLMKILADLQEEDSDLLKELSDFIFDNQSRKEEWQKTIVPIILAKDRIKLRSFISQFLEEDIGT